MNIIEKLQISAIINFLLFLATFFVDIIYYLALAHTIANLSALLSLFFYDVFLKKRNYANLKNKT